MPLTDRERDAFCSGEDFADLCAASRQEQTGGRYYSRKFQLQKALELGEISLGQYATMIREEAQRCGV